MATSYDCADQCLHFWNRYVYGKQMSPDEQACCVALEQAQIQSVPDNVHQYYKDVTAEQSAAIQQFADEQKAKAAGDVAAANKNQCPFPLGPFGCANDLNEVFKTLAKYGAIGIGALIVLYLLLIFAPFVRR